MPDSRRLALLLEYDGSRHAGSQLQANGPSIQGELEHALAEMTGSSTRVAFAGRTDAGVHALGQVVAFDTRTVYGCEEFVGGLNMRLPAAISVRAAREVDPAFDPRRGALARRYRYAIVSSVTRAPLQRGRAWQVAAALDLGAMQAAASLLVGEHDFAAFAAREAARLSTRREIYRACVGRHGRMIRIELTANAFLMHQVRRTVAALVDVGSGRLPMAEFVRHLHEARPGSYERAAPPHGLCLVSVTYRPPLFTEEQEQQ